MYDHGRPKGFAAWRPQAETRAILDQVEEVLETYQDHWPLTLRQVFYRLVAAYGYDKTDSAYKRLGDYLVRARRARLIPFECMRDDGWTQTQAGGFENPEHFWLAVQSTAERYTRDKQANQSRWLAVLCEAAGMVPQIERVADRYSVPVYSSGGFDSLTVKKSLADRVEAEGNAGRLAVFLHIGDLDPSGVCIFDSVAADVKAFISPPAEVHFERVALTPEQVDRYRLPTAPAKKTDIRGNNISETCQAEALPPNVLAEIVEAAIAEHTDTAVFEQDCRTEIEERADILDLLEEAGI